MSSNDVYVLRTKMKTKKLKRENKMYNIDKSN